MGFTALAISLLEPLLTGSRPRRGANAFVILADNSQSLQIRDGETTQHPRRLDARPACRRIRLEDPAGQDFDVRSYVFDSHLRAVDGFDALTFDGTGTALTTSLDALSKRFRGLPLAGVLLFTDGNRTDLSDLDLSQLPPIYPVVPPSRAVARDVGVSQVSISQTNFESAPVVIRADVSTVGFERRADRRRRHRRGRQGSRAPDAKATGDGKPLSFRFQFRPERKGVNFYRVQAFPAADEKKGEQSRRPTSRSTEQTLANNSRLVVVDQGAALTGCSM